MKKKSLKKIERRSDRAVTILVVLLIICLIIGYDVVWSHFHQTGVWNFFSIIAILLIALMPSFFNYRKEHAKIEQAYTDKMLELMVKDSLRKSHTDDEVRRVANVLTLTTLERLGPLEGAARGRILVFLKRSGLIDKDNPIVSLAGAPLYNAKCNTAELDNVDLSNAALYGAKLDGAHLKDANLAGAKLNGADLTWARLEGANLQNADLMNTKLYQVGLNKANLTGAQLDEKELEKTMFLTDTIMPDGTTLQR